MIKWAWVGVAIAALVVLYVVGNSIAFAIYNGS